MASLVIYTTRVQVKLGFSLDLFPLERLAFIFTTALSVAAAPMVNDKGGVIPHFVSQLQ